jgi:hypothetical protein
MSTSVSTETETPSEPKSTTGEPLPFWENPYTAHGIDPALHERWPISACIRAFMIDMTLRLCGLQPDGQPLKDLDGSLTSPPSPRDKRAALRLITTFERNSLEERKLNFGRDDESSAGQQAEFDFRDSLATEEVRAETTRLFYESPDPVEPEPSRAERTAGADRERANRLLEERWPLSKEVRGKIIGTTLELCGFAVGANGIVEQIPTIDEVLPPSNRDLTSALRILATFDKLSLEQKKLENREKDWKLTHLNAPYRKSVASFKYWDVKTREECIRRHGVQLPILVE